MTTSFHEKGNLIRCGFSLNLGKELTLTGVDVGMFSSMTRSLQFRHKMFLKSKKWNQDLTQRYIKTCLKILSKVVEIY